MTISEYMYTYMWKYTYLNASMCMHVEINRLKQVQRFPPYKQTHGQPADPWPLQDSRTHFHIHSFLEYLVTGGSEEMASATLSTTSSSIVPGFWHFSPDSL